MNPVASGAIRGSFDFISIFPGIDADTIGSLSENKRQGNRVADRLKTLNPDSNWRSLTGKPKAGAPLLFSSNESAADGGGYCGRGLETRHERPVVRSWRSDVDRSRMLCSSFDSVLPDEADESRRRSGV